MSPQFLCDDPPEIMSDDLLQIWFGKTGFGNRIDVQRWSRKSQTLPKRHITFLRNHKFITIFQNELQKEEA